MKAEQSQTTLRNIALAVIRRSSTNPRKNFDEAKLADLAENIKTNGVVSPLIVRPLPRAKIIKPDLVNKEWQLVLDGKGVVARWPEAAGKAAEEAAQEALELRNTFSFELVDGERRMRAAERIKLTEVPCVVRELNDEQARQVQLLTFLREDLSPLEQAEAYKELLSVTAGKNQDEKLKVLKEIYGLSRTAILGRIALLKLSGPVRQALLEGKITQSAADLISAVPKTKEQESLLKDVVQYGWSVRHLKDQIERNYICDLGSASFDPKDAKLTNAGACTTCPECGANAKETYPELALRPKACLNAECFKTKTRTWQAAKEAELKAAGATVLSEKETSALFPNSWDNTPRGAFISLDNWCHDTTTESAPYKKLLGKHVRDVKPVYAFRNGEQLELYRREDVHSVLKKAGVKFRTNAVPGHKETPEEKKKRLEQERKEKEAQEIARAAETKVLGALVGAVEKQKDLTPVYKFLFQVWTGQMCGYNQLDDALQRRGLQPCGGNETKAIKGMDGTQVLGLIVELAAIDFDEMCAEAVKLAEDLGVDVKGIRKQAAAELKAKDGKAEKPKAGELAKLKFPEAIAAVLAEKPLALREIADALIAGGYKFKSGNPYNAVGAFVYSPVGKEHCKRRADGKYEAKEVAK